MARIESNQGVLRPFNMAGLSGPLAPIARTNGLVFFYTAEITEAIDVQYDSPGEVVHSNEQYMVYKGTANRRISIGSIKFTADTLENAQYMLAAVQFFRVYSLMDFGEGKSGRPPSPMWFSCYGGLIFKDVPVLLNAASIRWPDDKDYVPYSRSALNTGGGDLFRQDGAGDPFIPSADLATPGGAGDTAWLPAILEISGVNLIVQHSPNYWVNTFSLQDFYSRGMVEKRETSGTTDSRPATPALLGTALGTGISKGQSTVLDAARPRIDMGSFSPLVDIGKKGYNAASGFLSQFGSSVGKLTKPFRGGS